MESVTINATTAMKTFLSVTEIAKVTKKERSTIIRWIKAGKFGNVRKSGNEYQIPHESFKKWWDENMNGVTLQEGNK